ncbi:MAG TPA: histidine kinase dimerization/phospho-acceptor domain-containing protein [Thermoanaerobaculia bacterium]|jgi:signal transduction histidine kinase
MNRDRPFAAAARADFLKQFFHDLATPLSAVALHLELAKRRVNRGEDPDDALVTARKELDRALQLFEEGREVLLGKDAESE